MSSEGKGNPGCRSAFTDTPGNVTSEYHFANLIFHNSLLEPFRKFVDEESKAREILTWNIESSGQLWVYINILETTLRAHINEKISSHFLVKEWWLSPEIIAPAHVRDFSRIDEVPNLSLPLLTLLFSRPYTKNLWIPIFEPLIIAGDKRRESFHKKLEFLRLIRNTIAHHGSIFHYDPKQISRVMGEVLALFDRMTADWIQFHPEFDQIADKRENLRSGGGI